MPSGEVDCYLLLGSNLGDRLGYIENGLQSIEYSKDIRLLSTSSLYETEPVGYTEQPNFLNMAAEVSTGLSATALLERVKMIESEAGRIHNARWRERELDIDIIFYGNQIITDENLVVPHERAHLRRFVLVPLNEIASGVVHPKFGKQVSELLRECPDNSSVSRIGAPIRVGTHE